MTGVVKSHRVSCVGAWGWSVTEPGAFEVWVSLFSYQPLKGEQKKKCQLKTEGKVKTGVQRRDSEKFRSLETALEKGTATHSSISCLGKSHGQRRLEGCSP